MVFSGFLFNPVLYAVLPTKISSLIKETQERTSSSFSLLLMIFTSVSLKATTEFVVPRSIPIAFFIFKYYNFVMLLCGMEKLHSFPNFGLWVGLCDLQMCAMCVGFPNCPEGQKRV